MPADSVLEDDVAIVTGAGRNIGREIAETFAAEGGAVVVADLDAGRAEETAQAIEDAGGSAVPAAVDVSDEADVVAMVETTEREFGPVDVLVNNAAINDRESLFDLSVETFDQVMAVNLRGPFLCTREVAKSMKDSGGGRIVNVGSTSAHKGRDSGVAYATSKSGVLNFTRSAARALAPFDIRVNTLSPTRTGSRVGADDPRSGPADEDILVGRWGTPADQAQAALFLVSPASEFVNGTELLVDGGSLA
jgi:NAD(P)-dependent dehydrogenase (short-subunit alcohol dehydrogenase family)